MIAGRNLNYIVIIYQHFNIYYMDKYKWMHGDNMSKRYTATFCVIILTIIGIFYYLQTRQSAGQAENQTVSVPIIMYHKLTQEKGLLGDYSITPEEFEEDLQYLKENGYHTITMSELIDFINGKTVLPDKPIILTFDDGYFSDYKYVYPLLKEYDMKAVFSVIGHITDEYTEEGRQDILYPHILWSMIIEMVESGHAELQNHGYDIHGQSGGVRGAKQRSGESDDEYKERLSADLSLFQARALEMIGEMPTTFTYPSGAYSPTSDDILRSLGFLASLTCNEKINKVTVGDADCLFGLGRLIRPHGSSIAAVLQKID